MTSNKLAVWRADVACALGVTFGIMASSDTQGVGTSGTPVFFGMVTHTSTSLRPDLGFADHIGPGFVLGLGVRGEFLRRAPDRLEAEHGQPFLDVRQRNDPGD